MLKDQPYSLLDDLFLDLIMVRVLLHHSMLFIFFMMLVVVILLQHQISWQYKEFHEVFIY